MIWTKDSRKANVTGTPIVIHPESNSHPQFGEYIMPVIAAAM
jgi:hypothetical protein